VQEKSYKIPGLISRAQNIRYTECEKMPEYWDPEIETMPVEDLNKLQEEKLKQLVHYV
jgi:hypothetical protein